MNKNKADTLEKLAWDSTADHHYLLQPTDYFSSWGNAAIVFLMLSDEEISPYLTDLLGWLQDLSWPGAEWILTRLQRVSSDLLVKPLESVAKLASDSKEESWLGYISILIANPNMINLLDAEILKLLEPFAVEYWKWDYDEIAGNFNLK